MTDVRMLRQEMAADDEINLKELLAIFWRRRLQVALWAVVFAGVALGISLILPKKYSASTLLSPVGQNSGGMSGLGSMLSQFSGLANLVGLSTSDEDKKDEEIALLQSTVITEKFIAANNLLPVLFAKRWDAASGRWRADVRVPTLWDGSQYFQKKIADVSTDPKSGLVTLTVEWKDPAVAADWANGLVQLTNQYARQKDIDTAVRSIAFLNAEAAKTPYVEERQGIFSILQSELTKETLAKGTEEYALEIIDPAFAPEKPSFPRPALFTALGLLLGILAGCAWALIRHGRGEAAIRRPEPPMSALSEPAAAAEGPDVRET